MLIADIYNNMNLSRDTIEALDSDMSKRVISESLTTNNVVIGCSLAGILFILLSGLPFAFYIDRLFKNTLTQIDAAMSEVVSISKAVSSSSSQLAADTFPTSCGFARNRIEYN